MTDQPAGKKKEAGFFKKAGAWILLVAVGGVIVYGLWMQLVCMTRPFAYVFGKTAQGTVTSTNTFRMSLWADIDFTDAAGKAREVDAKVLDIFDGELKPGATVTVHYFPWLASGAFPNGHVIDDLYTLGAWGIVAFILVAVIGSLWTKATTKRTSAP